MLPKASGLKSLVSGFFLATFVVLAPAQSAELAAVGTVEAVDCKAQTIQVFGITLFNSDPRIAKTICGLKATSSLNYVSLLANVDAAGLVRISRLTLVGTDYVPGATTVYVRGEVSSVREDIGSISISGAVIKTLQLPERGAIIEVVGTQPIPKGVVLPSTINVVSPPALRTDSSIGTGINSSIGTGLNSSIRIGVDSSIGTGRNSSIGTGMNSSIGTGRNSSIGIGMNSSIGTGRNSSIGTGMNSSIGTGLNSSIGTGTNSSIGTGLNSSIGTGTNSSIGTGLR